MVPGLLRKDSWQGRKDVLGRSTGQVGAGRKLGAAEGCMLVCDLRPTL